MTHKNTIIVIAPTRNQAKAMSRSLIETRGIDTDETHIRRLWEAADPVQLAGIHSEAPILEIRLESTELPEELENALQAVHTQKPKREVWARTSGEATKRFLRSSRKTEDQELND